MIFQTFEEALRAGSDGVTMKDVWTLSYNAFVMGGDVWQPIKTTVPVLGPFKAGRGYQVYAALSPKGSVHIVESETGAFIGASLDQVREDIKTGDPRLMKQQVEKAHLDLTRAQHVEPEEFWNKFPKER